MLELNVIIVNWNGKGLLEKCLNSLVESARGGNFKVTVVDNNSTDGSPDILSKFYPEISLIRASSNLGFAKANNLALAQTNTPYVLFLNPDTIPNDTAIRTMLHTIKTRADLGLVSCKTIGANGQVQPLGYQIFPTPLTYFIITILPSGLTSPILKCFFPFHNPKTSGYVKKLYGGCMMARMSALLDVGYFDERFFMYGEDVDLCRRLTDKGWKLFYLSEVKIKHSSGGTSRKAPHNFAPLMQSESIAKLMEKYYGIPGKLLFRFLSFIGSSCRIIMLLILAPFFILKGTTTHWKASLSKYLAIFRWTLNLENPTIPD